MESLTDGFIKAIAYSRSTIVNSNAELVIKRYLENNGKEDNEITKPELRDDLKHWLDFISSNSKFLEVERVMAEN